MIGVLISAWLDVRSKPLRTFAAIAGMVAAICAVVLVDAAGILSHDANREYIARNYGKLATVSIGGGDGPLLNASEAELAGNQLIETLVTNGVTRVTSLAESDITLLNGDKSASTSASWVSAAYPLVSFVNLTAGSVPVGTAQGDIGHAVVSLALAEKLGFSEGDAIGSSFWYLFNNASTDHRFASLHPLVIDGIASSIGTQSNPIDLIIVSDGARPEFDNKHPSHWLVNVDPADVGLVIGLAKIVRGGASNQPVFTARRVDLSAELAPLLDQQQVTGKAVTWVALIVGGLGILGVGLASVRERGKDFGLRRALGASKRRIFAGVIVQTLLEVLLAATIAIPLAAIAVELFARRLVLASLPLPASTGLPFSSALRGLIAALGRGAPRRTLARFSRRPHERRSGSAGLERRDRELETNLFQSPVPTLHSLANTSALCRGPATCRRSGRPGRRGGFG